MGTYVQQVPCKFKSYTVLAGTTVYEDTQSFPFPLTIRAIPVPGGTVTVDTSVTPNGAGLGASANWEAWPDGAVTSMTSNIIVSPVSAIRFTAATQNAVVEVAG